MHTLGGLFSGIGGIELGFEKAGFKTLWSNENDENCIKTYKHNFNHKIYSESILDINFKNVKNPYKIVKKPFFFKKSLKSHLKTFLTRALSGLYFLRFSNTNFASIFISNLYNIP